MCKIWVHISNSMLIIPLVPPYHAAAIFHVFLNYMQHYHTVYFTSWYYQFQYIILHYGQYVVISCRHCKYIRCVDFINWFLPNMITLNTGILYILRRNLTYCIFIYLLTSFICLSGMVLSDINWSQSFKNAKLVVGFLFYL